VAEVVTRIATGSTLAGGWTRSWLAHLETPDRFFRDLHLEGNLQEARVDVGRKGEWLPVDQAWRRMEVFLENEVREERREQQAAALPSGAGGKGVP